MSCMFFTEIGQFQKLVGGLIELVDELAKEAETEKMKVRHIILLLFKTYCYNESAF